MDGPADEDVPVDDDHFADVSSLGDEHIALDDDLVGRARRRRECAGRGGERDEHQQTG